MDWAILGALCALAVRLRPLHKLDFELLWVERREASGCMHTHIHAKIFIHKHISSKTMAAIVLELRPKFQELRAKETYTHEEVIDILCEFAKSIYPEIADERIREIVVSNF